jgi:CRISPR-associated protein Cas2
MLTEWWMDAFPEVPYERSAPGPKEMLSLIGYDICHPRRLHRVAKVCEDFGVRVQYSIFECHLDESRFERFWERLNQEIDPKEDRLVAYQIDAKSAKRTRTAGTMVCTEKVVVYLV